MTRKKTTEEFIADAISVHGDKFGYKNVRYDGAKVKVKITCLVHEDWDALPNDHLNGSGCPECGKLAVAASRRKNESQIRQEIYEVHGNRYLYREKFEYKNKDSKIDIFCKKHGWFAQSVHNHVFNKAGCPQCADAETSTRCRKNPAQFLRDAKEVHGDRYSYENVKYKTTHDKVAIHCYEHGIFWQEPSSHLSGRGCPSCKETGYRSNLSGYLYVLQRDDLIKVGITNKDPDLRCKSISNSFGRKLEVLKTYYFSDGRIPLNIEGELLRELRRAYQQPQERFDGSTECFYNVNLAALLNRIEELIASQTAAQAA